MWYYLTDGQQQGPLDEIALDKLTADGVLTSGTLVWKEGMTDWTPLGQARPGGSTVIVAGDAASSTCSICGKRVGADNLIELLGKRVCADCKPIAVQTLREGASLPGKNNTAWRDGKKVVAHHQGSLPARCYKCNQDVVTPPITRKLYWHPPAYYLLIFFNLIVYVLVAIFVRKRATLDIYLCERHVQRRKYFIIGGWSGAALGLSVAIAGMAMNVSWLVVLGFILLFASILAGLRGASLVRTARIKGDTVWLAGSGKEFLASLPPFS